jgi:hypothetical protein
MGRGRPAGRHVKPFSVTLTQRQIDYLTQKPNASKVIRRLIDQLMEAENLSPEFVHILELNNRLEALTAKVAELKKKRD